MKRARKAPDVPRTKLRLIDLIEPAPRSRERRQVNLKVPSDTLDRVHRVAAELGASKSSTIIALLNEGLVQARKRGAFKR